MNLKFTLLDGTRIEQHVSSETCLVGRSPKCDVVIPVDGMSRKHCQIEMINGEVFVTDLESTNGVFIEGVRIPANQPTHYATFLTLSFGAVSSVQIERDDATQNFVKVTAQKSPSPGPEKGTGPVNTQAPNLKLKKPASASKTPGLQKKTTTSKSSRLIAIFVIILLAAALVWWNTKNRRASGNNATESDEYNPASPSYDQF